MTTLDEIVAAHDRMKVTRSDAADAASEVHGLVADALNEGVRAADIADALGVTRGRVYQLQRKADAA